MISISRIQDADFDAYKLLTGLAKDGRHVALVWLDEEGDLRIAHKTYKDIEVLRREVNNYCVNHVGEDQFYVAETKLEKSDVDFLINYLDVHFSIRESCEYGYNFEGFTFLDTGLHRGDFRGSGINCGSFIVKILKDQLDIDLLDLSTFIISKSDVDKHKLLLESIANDPSSYNVDYNKLDSEVGKFKSIDPIVVCAALSIEPDTYPVTADSIDPLRQQIAEIVCA
jgi:hypothetical protein